MVIIHRQAEAPLAMCMLLFHREEPAERDEIDDSGVRDAAVAISTDSILARYARDDERGNGRRCGSEEGKERCDT